MRGRTDYTDSSVLTKAIVHRVDEPQGPIV